MARKIIITSQNVLAGLVALALMQTVARGAQLNLASPGQKAAETPHLWQLDPRGGFKNDGRNYCCPTAVANSLVYLAHHGFPNLLSKGEGVQPQIDLINLLASPHYMGTDPNTGTKPGALLSGVQKYVMDQGYQCSTLEYEGWRSLGRGREGFFKAARPDLDWLKKGVLDPNGAAWLNVGWYARTGNGQWKRTGGHWVTLVGFDAADSRVLLVHNPETHGKGDKPVDPAKDVVTLQPVLAGKLDTGNGPIQDAAGMYQISGPGLPMKPEVDAFLDSAIVLVVVKW